LPRLSTQLLYLPLAGVLATVVIAASFTILAILAFGQKPQPTE